MAELRSLDEPAKLDRYLELKAEIKRLTAELKEIEPEILDALMAEPEEDGKQAVRHLGCEITVQRRKSYRYSEGLEEMMEDVKLLKAREQRDGTAEVVKETAFLRVTQAR
ncbi:MAG: hypothetical protein AAGI08_00105 [Bacteroidota bacterium]